MLTLLGGLALFLIGLNQASRALEALGGSTLRAWLSRATRGVVRAFFAGTLVTAVVQSGTAMTVTVISLVEAGVLAAAEGLAMSMGAIAGGTVALQLAAFRVYDYALPIIAVGYFASLWKPLRHGGRAVAGIGLFFLGLDVMIKALTPETQGPLMQLALDAVAANPLWMAGLALVFTALVHSSNAAAAMAMAFYVAGRIPLEAGLAAVVGAAVGTTFTPLLAAMGAGAEARRVALGHLIWKAAFGLVALALLEPLSAAVAALGGGAARQVANAHTLFNLIAGLVALPFIPALVRLLERMLPERRGAVTPKYLSEEALSTPELALSLALREVVRISDHVQGMMATAVRALAQGEGDLASVQEREEKVDRLTQAVVMYLARLKSQGGGEAVEKLLLLAGELEHLADQIRRLLKQQDKLRSQGLEFSPEGRAELSEAASRVYGRMQRAFTALATGNHVLAREVVSEHPETEAYLQKLRQAHLSRLEAGRPESRATSAAHLDMLMTLDVIDAEVTRVAELADAVYGSRDGEA
ncbi:Na+/Picotransporter [Oceanithermus profundus DSM 14977]|uniref:Na+/Picotransporter n=1 Tax=Oceanithermus profundus (strain DSM 14977 / NBRC 100410 / VKM B-2274 / 506) TaxID=670487 RepID=E4U8N0_OCEP5|nr:Na/Pi cotransporter family protein [Oceanithermus profundus]ADR36710.1 Na+/Picotransporter [Oceanithermus profundus DSM 14977]